MPGQLKIRSIEHRAGEQPGERHPDHRDDRHRRGSTQHVAGDDRARRQALGVRRTHDSRCRAPRARRCAGRKRVIRPMRVGGEHQGRQQQRASTASRNVSPGRRRSRASTVYSPVTRSRRDRARVRQAAEAPGRSASGTSGRTSAASDSQNNGIDTPMSDTTRRTESTGRSRRNAANVPSPMPMTMPMAMAVPASSSVAGTNSARSVRTGRWLCWESPRSPWTTLPR